MLGDKNNILLKSMEFRKANSFNPEGISVAIPFSCKSGRKYLADYRFPC